MDERCQLVGTESKTCIVIILHELNSMSTAGDGAAGDDDLGQHIETPSMVQKNSEYLGLISDDAEMTLRLSSRPNVCRDEFR